MNVYRILAGFVCIIALCWLAAFLSLVVLLLVDLGKGLIILCGKKTTDPRVQAMREQIKQEGYHG